MAIDIVRLEETLRLFTNTTRGTYVGPAVDVHCELYPKKLAPVLACVCLACHGVKLAQEALGIPEPTPLARGPHP